MKERSIRTNILHYLNSLPRSDFWVSPPGSPTSLPDICGVLNGRAVYVEVKVPGKKPRKAQVWRMNRLEKAGAIVFTANSIGDASHQLYRRGLRTYEQRCREV